MTDTFGTIRAANQATEELFGRPRYELIGRPLAVYVPLESRGQFRSALASLINAGEREQWRAALRVGGANRSVRLTVGVRRDQQGKAKYLRWLLQPASDGVTSTEAPRDDGGSAPSTVERTIAGGAVPTIVGKSAWLLSQAGAILGSSFDYELNLRSALELMIPWFADWAVLDLLSESTGIRRVAVVRASTEDRGTAALLARRPPSLGDPADPIARVLCGGPPELVKDTRAGDESAPVSTSWGREVIERLAPRSWITVALRARGRTIGALTFLTARSGRSFGLPQLLFAQQLADRAALAADNARLYDEAMRASEAKSAFLAVMSHELRTPLTAIIGYTELLAEGLFGPVSAEQRLQLGRVRESSEHLLHIVEEVLHYARLDARREHAEFEQVEVESLLDQAMTLIRPLAERKGLALHVEGPPERAQWRSDPGRVRQILVNLLGNAVKFTERGEVRLMASVRDELVVFEVHDTGPGIPAAMLDRIFEPFWQADQRFTRQQPGSGLGLSVTRELATLLGGGVDVRSSVGVGSTFTVWLPRHLSDDAAAPGDAGSSPHDSLSPSDP